MINALHIYKKICLCLALSVCLLDLTGQNINMPVTLQWQPVRYEYFQADTATPYLYFKQASTHENNSLLPCYQTYIPISHSYDRYEVSLTNTIWQTLSEDEMRCVDKNMITNDVNIQYQTTETQKQAFLYIHFCPFRTNGQKIEKLISFNIVADYTPGTPPKIRKTHTYADHSVLAAGTFYKISLQETGIYKLTYNDCKNLGMNMPVNINNIAIFGNGGQQLPENTSYAVFDDIQEIPVSVVDNNNNGYFDNDDYVIFYAVGLQKWTADNIHPLCQFSHSLNPYSLHAYYFITVDNGIGEKKRIHTLSSADGTPTHEVSTYYYRHVYETDNYNIYKTGTRWFADEFKSTTKRTYNFTIPGLITNKNIYFSFAWASISSTSATFLATFNNSKHFTAYFSGNNLNTSSYKDFIPNQEKISVEIEYSKPTLSSAGYLDYIEIHATCSLAQNASQISFRNPEIVGSGNIARYTFNTLGKNTRIWEVTDRHNIKQIDADKDNNRLSFTLTADTLREFVAFDGTSYLSVTPIGKIENQNLHGIAHADFIIITHPNFLSAAQKLAQFRQTNDNMNTVVVTTNEIYNEFSSGSCDLAAIRNFLKMFYDRDADHMPKNVLLIGKTSYDPRQIIGTAPCYIPNYQGHYIFDAENNTSTDNFIAKLADGKGTNNFGTMDIGIGRWPVTSLNQANALVDKSTRYASNTDLSNASGKISNMGNWRNILAFVADDDFDYAHMFEPEDICNNVIKNNYPIYNIDKIYSDAYKKMASSQGARYPEVNKNINLRVNNGCLFMTYFGHGGDNGWSHERILTLSDIASWTNTYALPIFYTACCSFSQYDNSALSPGERVLLSTKGGGIGLITSTRNSASYYNGQLGQYLFANALEENNKQHLTIGEVYANAQNAHGMYEAYTYLGDPSVTPAFPKMNVVTDSINHHALATFTDTLKSLTYVCIHGHVEDTYHQPISDFNGWIYPTIYDKAVIVETINNNGKDSVHHFSQQKNIIFKGKAKVENGHFQFSFMLPKDINYEYGFGKISYYAAGNNTDANGYNKILVGGINDTTLNDNIGPEIKLYLNDENFVNGGTSTASPIIKAEIRDAGGINTAGAGIGHDIVAILDDNIAQAVTLNDFFEFDENSFTSGKLSYALSALTEGKHTLKLRAWDIVNNMGEAEIEFYVINDTGLVLNHVLNYPNPFTTHTSFYFEHNQPNTLLDIHISIFTISGKVVKNIHSTQYATGYRSDAIEWDGKDDYGNTLAKGVYIYKLAVRKPDGGVCEKIEKIVIL